jgi:hypothetical protein
MAHLVIAFCAGFLVGVALTYCTFLWAFSGYREV